ncbi:hypothetical protein ES754_02825 [Psychrobacter frigidicola]|uniref:Uncharacterized protein n=1 Tax=Psychrobacter frigidicola TaxID=45611 RepID=A0A5C7A871_9GAMM|nr:hypothetical protein [Psychrobacter frigidicola]TXD97906.1 hypothetical protein ES754_02825 [Psychrobacter frigidicola]
MSASSKWQRKLNLLFKSEKTLNAKAIIGSFSNKSIDDMKTTVITESMCNSKAISDKPRIKNLESHLDGLKHQFIHQSELCFYHATLIVLLRRNYKPQEVFAEFERLWAVETDYLLNNLSLRWIVSACDSFIDYSADTTRAAVFLNVITLINTLKVYETKQFLQLSSVPDQTPLLTDKVAALYSCHLPLYDGLTYFRIGTDDTLKHMRSRYQKLYTVDKLATTVLLFVFDRLQSNNSAFATLRALHQDEKSKWWLD